MCKKEWCLSFKTNFINKYFFPWQVTEVLDMLINHLESRNCRDQVYLLLYEPHSAELLYGVLADSNFSMDLKQKIVKLISILLRSERVYEIHKGRMRLQDGSVISASHGMVIGFVSLLAQQQLTMEVTAMLLNQFLSSGITVELGYSRSQGRRKFLLL